jgi:hypothetical protein
MRAAKALPSDGQRMALVPVWASRKLAYWRVIGCKGSSKGSRPIREHQYKPKTPNKIKLQLEACRRTGLALVRHRRTRPIWTDLAQNLSIPSATRTADPPMRTLSSLPRWTVMTS